MHKRIPVCLIILALLLNILSVPFAAAQEDAPETGTINNEQSFVTYPLTVEQDGSLITLDMQQTSGSLDTLLYLVEDSTGAILAENDDWQDDRTRSYIQFPQADAGQYSVIATRYKVADGDTEGDFELKIEVNEGVQDDTVTYDTSPDALAVAGYPAIQPRDKAEWTILVYYGADTNLEPGILNDFNEFEMAGGSSQQVRVVLLMDRHPEYTDASGDWTTARLYEVGPNESEDNLTIDSAVLADLGEPDTGSGETLAQFLVWGISNYPAERYAVALGSHGAGWEGLITDDSSDRDILSIPELKRAFEIAAETAGVEKFDLLINDACSMSSVEYHAAMSAFFHYSIASPEIVIDPALDMTLFTEVLNNEPDTVDLTALGKTMVDLYITRDILLKESSDAVFFTHAMTDLDRFDPVVQATERFAQIINDNPAVYSTLLGQARSNTYTYAFFMGTSPKIRIDLGSFMRQIIALSEDADLIVAAQDVLAALNDARVYGNAGERAARRTSYYNIYFPEDSDDFRISYFAESPLSQWGKMLRNYYNAVTPQVWAGDPALAFHPPVAPQVSLTQVFPEVGSVAVPFGIGVEVVGRNISHGTFTVDHVLDDGTIVRLQNTTIVKQVADTIRTDGLVEWVNKWDSGVVVDVFRWSPDLPVVSDGETTDNEALVFSSDVWSLDGRYQEPGSDTWNDVAIIFSLEGSVQRVVSRNPGSDALGVVEIAPGSAFQAYRQIVTPDGRVAPEPGTQYTWPEGGLTWNTQPAPSGQYNLGFLLTTFGGTNGFGSVSVAVDNDNADLSLQGYTNTERGMSFSYPGDWKSVSYFESNQIYTASNEDETTWIYIKLVETDVPNPVAVANSVIDAFSLELVGDPVPVNLGGRGAVEFTFTYEWNGTWIGKAFAIYREELGMGMVLWVEALEELAEQRDYVYGLLHQITFFDPTATSTAVWTVDRSFGNAMHDVQFPVRESWLDNRFERDSWFGYADAPGSATFALVTRLFGGDPAVVLDGLLEQYAKADTEAFELIDTRTYYGENHVWEAARYTATRDGLPVTGRLYVTLADGLVYAMWFETPTDEETSQTFTQVFEPMLDGFAAKFVDLGAYASGSSGASFKYPVSWTRAAAAEDGAYVQTGNRTDTALIRMYPVPGETDLEAAAGAFVESLGAESDLAFTPIIVGDQEALAFDFSYVQHETDLWEGHAFAVYLDAQDTGLVFSAEALAGAFVPDGIEVAGGSTLYLSDLPPDAVCRFTLVNARNVAVVDYDAQIGANGGLIQAIPEGGPFYYTLTCGDVEVMGGPAESGAAVPAEVDAAYQLLLNTIEFRSTDTINDVAAYPVPAAWMDGFEDGAWRRYTPGTDPDSAIFAATTSYETEDTPGTVLEVLFTDRVISAADEFSIDSLWTIQADPLAWETVRYTATRGDERLEGVMYATMMDGVAYGVWAEAPVGDWWQLYEDVFEPLLLGFEVY